MSAQLDALRSFVSGRAAVPNATASRPSVLVVGSGKGGAGTSVVAALVALAAAAAGRRVLLVDADPHVGPQRYLLGLGPVPSIADLRAGADVASLVVPVSATLSLVAGGPGAADPVDPSEQRALLRRVGALYPEHDLVVVDGGSRLDAVCACCESSGGAALPARLLVVTGTDAIALAASYALVKAARERTAATAGGPVTAAVLVNRHDDADGAAGFAQIAEACALFLGEAPSLLGTLPDDVSLDLALRAGMPLQDAAAGSPAAVAAKALVDRLLAELAHDTKGTPDQTHDRTRRTSPSYAPSFRPSAVPTGAPR